MYGENYIKGHELKDALVGLFYSGHTPGLLRESWESRLKKAICFLYERGILFRSLYDVEIEDRRQIQRGYHSDYKLYLSMRYRTVQDALGQPDGPRALPGRLVSWK